MYRFKEEGTVLSDYVSGFVAYSSFTVRQSGDVMLKGDFGCGLLAIVLDHSFKDEVKGEPEWIKNADPGKKYEIESINWGTLSFKDLRLRRRFRSEYANELQYVYVFQFDQHPDNLVRTWFDFSGWYGNSAWKKPTGSDVPSFREHKMTYGDISDAYVYGVYDETYQAMVDGYDPTQITSLGVVKKFFKESMLTQITAIANDESQNIKPLEIIGQGKEAESKKYFSNVSKTSMAPYVTPGFVMIADGAFKTPRINRSVFNQLVGRGSSDLDALSSMFHEWALGGAHDIGSAELEATAAGQRNTPKMVRSLATAHDRKSYSTYDSGEGPIEMIFFDSGSNPLPM